MTLSGKPFYEMRGQGNTSPYASVDRRPCGESLALIPAASEGPGVHPKQIKILRIKTA
jgi:hypothetical protein